MRITLSTSVYTTLRRINVSSTFHPPFFLPSFFPSPSFSPFSFSPFVTRIPRFISPRDSPPPLPRSSFFPLPLSSPSPPLPARRSSTTLSLSLSPRKKGMRTAVCVASHQPEAGGVPLPLLRTGRFTMRLYAKRRPFIQRRRMF